MSAASKWLVGGHYHTVGGNPVRIDAIGTIIWGFASDLPTWWSLDGRWNDDGTPHMHDLLDPALDMHGPLWVSGKQAARPAPAISGGTAEALPSGMSAFKLMLSAHHGIEVGSGMARVVEPWFVSGTLVLHDPGLTIIGGSVVGSGSAG